MRKKRGLRVGTIVVGAVALALAAVSAHGSSRKVEKIAEKHEAAIGGDKLKSIEAVRALGVVEVRGLTVPFTLWRQRPDLSRMEISLMGNDVVQAYDGDSAWWVNPLAGATTPEEMPDDFAREMILWSDFEGPLVGYKQKRHKIKYVGKEELEAGDAHKLRVLLASGGEVTIYIDLESYLEVRRTHTQQYRGEQLTINTYFSDFEEDGGVTSPRTIRGVGFGGEAFTMRLETIDLGVASDRTRFDMPGRRKKAGD